MYCETRFRKSALRSAVLLALSINGAALTLSAGEAQAVVGECADTTNWSSTPAATDRANFTMLDAGGYDVGGTNDVAATWDGMAYNASSDYTGPGSAANVTASSTTGFFGHNWTAHTIQVFAPGSYTFDVTAGGNLADTESGTLDVTVGAGQIGMHMLFDWNTARNIDVFVVADLSSVFGPGFARSSNVSGCDTTANATVENCLWDGPGFVDGLSANKPAGGTVWMLSSMDGDSDGVMGVPMPLGGPFEGFNANFNFNFSNVTAPLALKSGSACNPSADVLPDPFSFTDVTGANPSTIYESNTITVSGLGSGVNSPISISGGEYSVSMDGGLVWLNYSTTTPATVSNGDLVKVRQTSAATDDGTTTNTTLNIGGVFDTYSVTTIDNKPAAFSFTDQTGVATSTAIESNTITVTGLGSGVSVAISVDGGQYRKNGGSPTSTAGTVVNGDTVSVLQTSAASDGTTTNAILTISTGSNAVSDTFSVTTAGGAVVSSTGNNFTMLDGSGGVTGGTNDVAMFWDGNFNISVNDPVTAASAHMRLSSGTPFFSFPWTAHHIRVFGPGTYTIDTTCTTGQLEAGVAACGNPVDTANGQTEATRYYTFTVGTGQIAAHMLFDWNVSKNIDVVNIWDENAVFGPSPMFTGAQGFNDPATIWTRMSSDWDGDGQNGAAMIDGPFTGFKANFNLNFAGTLAPTNYVPSVNVPDPSNAPGCSISPKPIAALERGDWWLVAGFLAWMGALRKRFKRQAQS